MHVDALLPPLLQTDARELIAEVDRNGVYVLCLCELPRTRCSWPTRFDAVILLDIDQ
jgi:hypothetical protein